LKRFHFRLEQVLRVRRVQEDIARGALMLANREAQTAADAVNARVAEYTDAARPFGAQSYDTFNRMQSHLDNAAAAITVARAEYKSRLDVVETRRAEWAAARQRVAALERLEEPGYTLAIPHDDSTRELAVADNQLFIHSPRGLRIGDNLVLVAPGIFLAHYGQIYPQDLELGRDARTLVESI